MGGDDRELRAAQNEHLFRQLNDRLHALAQLDGAAHAVEQFACECVSGSCSVVVELTPGEYAAVRADPRRFLVVPSAAHTAPELEVVVERHERYWVVEKRGEAGVEAEYLADHGPSVL